MKRIKKTSYGLGETFASQKYDKSLMFTIRGLSVQKKSNHYQYKKNALHDIDVTC